jgi:hypothetical protein
MSIAHLIIYANKIKLYIDIDEDIKFDRDNYANDTCLFI